MTVTTPEKYYDRNQKFRSGRGLLIAATSEQGTAFAERLASYQGDYSPIANNCTDPIESALAAAGYETSGNPLVPTGLARSLAPSAIGQTFYPKQSVETRFFVPPWMKAAQGSFWGMP